MKYKNKSFPFTSIKLRSIRILSQIFSTSSSMQNYSLASDALSYLLPLLKTTDNLEVFEFLVSNKPHKFISEKLLEYVCSLYPPMPSMVMQVLFRLKESPEEALSAIVSKRFETWFINSAKCYALLACVYMINAQSGVKSAAKAYELCRDQLYTKIYVYALVLDKSLKKAAEIARMVESDEEFKLFCSLNIKKDWKFLEEFHVRDPRNCELTEELIGHFLQKKDTQKAVVIANRHVEYRGRSAKAREVLAKVVID